MCRFIAYQGLPILLSDLLFAPQHSLVNQSTGAVESMTTLNGDGFGIGWYNHAIDDTPAVFTSIQPAWNDANLLNISHKIESTNFFAHVRSATMGGVSRLNCHPFHHKNYLFMHNGTIAGFRKIKRTLRRELADEMYDSVDGQTDSEHFFALIMNYYLQDPQADMPKAFISALKQLETIQVANKITGITLLNTVLSDGERTLVTRYTSHPEQESNTLYYYQGNPENICPLSKKNTSQDNSHAIILASEKLSDAVNWQEVPVNHLMFIEKDLSFAIQDLNSLK